MDPYCNIPAPCIASGCICFWSTGFWCQNWSPPGASPNTEEQSEHQIFGERTGPLPCIPESQSKTKKATCVAQKHKSIMLLARNVVHGKPIRKLLERVFHRRVAQFLRQQGVWKSGFVFWNLVSHFGLHLSHFLSIFCRNWSAA